MSEPTKQRSPKNTGPTTDANNVRPGQRRSFRKADVITGARRLEEIIAMLGRAMREHDIIKYFKDSFESAPDSEKHIWDLSRRMIVDYIARAREEMLRRQNRPKTEIRSESIAFYEGIINDPKASVRDKLKARERIDEVFGVDAPKTVNQRIGDSQGKPLAPTVVAPTVQFIMPDNGRGKKS